MIKTKWLVNLSNIRKKKILRYFLPFLYLILGWFFKYYYLDIGFIEFKEIFIITISSLLLFVPFIGTMLIFGFNRILDKLNGPLYVDKIKGLQDGWLRGLNLFKFFIHYVFFVIITNVTVMIFLNDDQFSFGLILMNIIFVLCSLDFVMDIFVKICDIDQKLEYKF